MHSNRPDKNLRSVLQLCEQMLLLARDGDEHRLDAGCGVVFGTLRDMAYKMRALAGKELERHRSKTGKASSNAVE